MNNANYWHDPIRQNYTSVEMHTKYYVMTFQIPNFIQLVKLCSMQSLYLLSEPVRDDSAVKLAL
jgi:hypothetical protein